MSLLKMMRQNRPVEFKRQNKGKPQDFYEIGEEIGRSSASILLHWLK